MNAPRPRTHEQLLAAGFEELGDGVYVRETPEGLEVRGNAYERDNVVFLDTRTYGALRRFATKNGYEKQT